VYSPADFKRPLRRPTSYREYIEFEERDPLTPADMEATLQEAQQQAQRRMEQDEKLKANIRRFRFVVRTLNLGCSIVVIALITSNFTVFNETRFALNNSGNPLWGSEGVKTWPTTVLLCVACVSSFLSIIILLSYLKSIRWANRLAVAHATISVAAGLFLLFFWALSVGIFNVHDKSGTPDLWSHSCTQKTAGQNSSQVNWSQMCLEQSWCSVCGILSIVFEVLILTTFLLIYLRRRSKRQVRQSQHFSTFLRTATAVQDQSQAPLQPEKWNDVKNKDDVSMPSPPAYMPEDVEVQ